MTRRLVVVIAALATAAACGNGSRTPPAPSHRAAGAGDGVTARLGDQIVRVTVAGDTIATVAPVEDGAAAAAVGYVMPAIIDSHVHLAYWPVSTALADHGVAAAVDLGAPIETLTAKDIPAITVIAAGPLLTQPSGYPLDSWGPDGYGLGCADAACVERAVGELADKGAGVIKVAIAENGLAPPLVKVAVAAAHARGLRVAAHALSDPEAATAAAAGCDLLAHTPIDPLSDSTIAAWKGRAVISTLAAFGGSAAAVDNLRRLRAAGVTVLYGTDLGNQRDDGPSGAELALLAQAGLDGAAIVDAMTSVPAAYWKLDRLGAIAAGKEASLIVVGSDPRVDPTVVLRPREVWIQGHKR